MLVIGLAIGIPGIKLITLGGSVWFTAMGIVMLIAAIYEIVLAASFCMHWALSRPSFGQFTMPDGRSGLCSHACLPSPFWHFWLPCCGLLCAHNNR
jgi:hypothetical protein